MARKNMKKDYLAIINRTLFNEVAATASIISLYFTAYPVSEPRPSWHFIALTLALIYAGYSIWKTGKGSFNNRKVVFDDEEIDEFMCEWVATKGQTVIFSRDMSWGVGGAARETLLNKSEANEISVYLENEIEICKELRGKGANVVVYGTTGYRPRSRFTFVKFGRDGARLAVGLPEGDKHAVYFFEQGKDPIFSIAEDLIRFLDGMERK